MKKMIVLVAIMVMAMSAAALASDAIPTYENCQKYGQGLEQLAGIMNGKTRSDIQAAAREDGNDFSQECTTVRRLMAKKTIGVVKWANNHLTECRSVGADISSSYEIFQSADERLERMCGD